MRRALVVTAAALALTACARTVDLYPLLDGGTSSGKGAGGAGGFGSDDAGGTDEHCSGAPSVVTFTPDAPQVVLVLDRSSSMNQLFPNSGSSPSPSHLTAAVNALYSQVTTYTMARFQRTIHFSFVDFPDPGTSGCASTPDCCANAFASVNTSNYDLATSCESPTASCVASASRPTDAALLKADQALTTSGFTGPRYVLLISDGDPQGCASDDCALTQRDGIPALSNDHAALEVVAIQGANSIACLQDLAMTATGNTRAPSYTAVNDPTSLNLAIQAAVASTLCSVTLTNPPASTSSLQVYVGNSTTMSPTNNYDGWSYDPTSGGLRLHGNTCDTYNMTQGALFVTSGCTQGHPGPAVGP